MKTLPQSLIAFLVCFFCTTALLAQEAESQLEWPSFRGPAGNGSSAKATPPTQWSSTENVAWKQKIPGRGSSSPIVVANRVFITSAIPADPNAKQDQPSQRQPGNRRSNRNQIALTKQKFLVLCYERTSGDLIWEKIATQATPTEGHHRDHGFASASPVTDGEKLYVNFGSFGLYCYDFDGNLIWKRDDLGTMKTRNGFGQGSSVTISDGVLLLPWDHEGQSYIAAINCDNGETKWKKLRDEPSCWASPTVAEVDGRKIVLQSGQNFSRAYDFQTGEEVWKASGLTTRPIGCPVTFDGLAFFTSARGGAVIQAIPLSSKGDVSGDGVAWTLNRQAPDVPSLLLSENRLYFTSGSKGIFNCVNAKTGETFFEPQRLPVSGVYSSPVAANGNVFITGRGGKTVVIRDSVDYAEVSTNDIGEPVDATLALVGKEIFIRGEKHLFCIRNK